MFTTHIKVNFYDADPVGIMFFGNIFRFAHSVYEEMIGAGNFERNYFFDEEYAIPILHADVDFIKPIFPGRSVKVEIVVNAVKESSFEVGYRFINEEGELTAKMKTVHVFIRKQDWGKTQIPTEFMEYLIRHLEQ